MFCLFSLSVISCRSPGFSVDKAQYGLRIRQLYDSPTPFKKGDLIVGINGVGYQDILSWILHGKPDRHATYKINIVRDQQQLTIAPEMNVVLPFRVISVAWPQIVLILTLLFLGILAFLRAPEDQPGFLFLLCLCFFATTFSATLPSLFGVLEPVVISLSFLTLAVCNWLAFGTFLHFVFKFPVGRDLVRERPWLIALFYLAPPLISIAGAAFLAGGTGVFWGWLQRTRNVALPFMALATFGKQIMDYRRLHSSLERIQIKLIMNAYWLSFGPWFVLYSIPNILFDHPFISFRIVVLSGIILPGAYFVALVSYRLLDVDKMISRTVTYFLLIALLDISYSSLVITLKRRFIGMEFFSEEIFLIYVIAVAIFFEPVFRGVSFVLDHVFQPKILYRYDMLPALSRNIGSCVLFKDLVSLLTSAIPEDLHLTSACLVRFAPTAAQTFPEYAGIASVLGPNDPIRELFAGTTGFKFTKGSPVGPPLQRDLALLEEAGFELIFPLRGGEGLSGLFLIGRRKGLRPFTRRDIDIFTTISNHAGVTLENIMRYESLLESKKQVEQMFTKLVQSKKMAALGEMSTVLAHELRNPLGIIRSSAQHLRNQVVSPENQEELLDYIVDEVDGLGAVINNILGLARYKKPVLAPVDLKEEIETMISRWLVSGNHRQEVRISLTFVNDIPAIFADFRQLQQVFLNCISNAEDALMDGGEVEIFVKSRDNIAVQIEIMDDGPGIHQGDIEKAFKKFYTTKEKGIGIGLPVCRQIIRAHNGTISITNREGRGLKVDIVLPCNPLATLPPANETRVGRNQAKEVKFEKDSDH